jgi:hypothetical protein
MTDLTVNSSISKKNHYGIILLILIFLSLDCEAHLGSRGGLVTSQFPQF